MRTTLAAALLFLVASTTACESSVPEVSPTSGTTASAGTSNGTASSTGTSTSTTTSGTSSSTTSGVVSVTASSGTSGGDNTSVGATSSGVASVGATTNGGGTSGSPTSGSVTAGSTTSGAFSTAPHQAFSPVGDNGTALLAHPQLFTVSYTGFVTGTSVTVNQYADWIVQSAWLSAVGADYGVGLGTHVADVILPNPPAPGTIIDDSDIQPFLAGFAADAGGLWDGGSLIGNPNVYVMLFMPEGVSVTLGGIDAGYASCSYFGGYHGFDDGGSFVYGVIPDCQGLEQTPPDYIWTSTSHELIEGSTDPDGDGWFFYDDYAIPWALDFSEVGDVCVGSGDVTDDAGFTAQRIWSNAAAAAGTGSPCIPVPDGEIYYSVSPVATGNNLLENLQNGLAVIGSSSSAQSVTFTVTGWSDGPVAGGWTVYAVQTQGNFNPTAAFGNGLAYDSIDNGDALTLTVTVPANTPAGSLATFELTSFTNLNTGLFNEWPVAIYVAQ